MVQSLQIRGFWEGCQGFTALRYCKTVADDQVSLYWNWWINANHSSRWDHDDNWPVEKQVSRRWVSYYQLGIIHAIAESWEDGWKEALRKAAGEKRGEAIRSAFKRFSEREKSDSKPEYDYKMISRWEIIVLWFVKSFHDQMISPNWADIFRKLEELDKKPSSDK